MAAPMSALPPDKVLRTELRSAFDSVRSDASGLCVTLHGERDLQHLVDLVRQLGSNPLLAEQLQRGGQRVVIQIAPGPYGANACGCGGAGTDAMRNGAMPAPGAGETASQTGTPMEGLVSLKRLQALDGQSDDVILAADAVLTPTARDWLRTHRVRVRRSTS